MPLAETLAPTAGGALPLETEEEKRRRLAAILGLAPPMPIASPVAATPAGSSYDGSRSMGGMGAVEPIPNAMPGDARVEPIPNAVPGEARMEPLASPAYSPGPRMSSQPVPDTYPANGAAPPLNPADLWPDPYRDRFGTARAAAPAMELGAKPDTSAPMGSPSAEAAKAASGSGAMSAQPTFAPDVKDHPSKWGRFKNALGAAGLEMLNGGGILRAGQAAFMGAKASQRGPTALGAYGDMQEDREMVANQARDAVRMKPYYDQQERDRQAQLDQATIDTKKAQATWYGERGDIKRQELELRAAKATAEELQKGANIIKNDLLRTGQPVPAHITKAATGYAIDLTPEERIAIVAGADGIYAVNKDDLSDATRITAVPAKPPAGALGDDVELRLRQEYGDPEAEADNPEFEPWRKSIGEEKAFRKSMYGRLMTPEEKDPSFVPPPDFDAQLRQRWEALSPDEKGVFYDQVQGSPKRKIKNSEKPGFMAGYKKRELEMRQKARNPGIGTAAPTSGAIPKTESDARAAAKRAFPGDEAAQLEYMREWSQTPR